MTLKPFEYYEIRPCVDFGWNIESFLGEPNAEGFHNWESALQEAMEVFEHKGGERLFWTLYGVSGTTTIRATAIGEFGSFTDAYDVMVAILMPMRQAATLLESAVGMANGINEACSILEDICNQSSTEERL